MLAAKTLLLSRGRQPDRGVTFGALSYCDSRARSRVLTSGISGAKHGVAGLRKSRGVLGRAGNMRQFRQARLLAVLCALVTTVTLGVGVSQTAFAATVSPRPAPTSHSTNALRGPTAFRDPSPQAIAAHISAAGQARISRVQVTPYEVHVLMPYCRTNSGLYYWMQAGENPWDCSLGYVKYYDSVYGDFRGAIDVYGAYWQPSRSTALATGWAWCKSNFICATVVAGVLYDGIKRMWPLLLAAE